MKKKLIEVALPLEKINEESAREKSIRHGHPSTLHLWWSRKPTATARAVIWASLVDDPSSHPEQFPTEEDQNRERQRLFRILEELVVWENSNNERVLDAAKAEIMKSTDNNPPELLDPFAGGGSIPLEAQRLGLVAHAHDLNPVAVMINKAMIEIPPKFAGRPPVNPEWQDVFYFEDDWAGARGLAEDVRYYGEWMKQKAWERIGHLYPKVQIPKEQGGGEATVIAWLWFRTVKCPNPMCGCEVPLTSSFIISKKKGHEAWVEPIFENRKATYKVHMGKPASAEGTMQSKKGAVCPCCGTPIGLPYIREEGKAQRMGVQLCAVVAEGNRKRLYISPDKLQLEISQCPKPQNYPNGGMPNNPRWFSPPAFGMSEYSDLFTSRQLTALTTFSDLVAEAQQQAQADAIVAGLPDDDVPLCDGGTGAHAYGEAVGVYLAFAVDRESCRLATACVWNSTGEKVEQTFTRQAIPMVWNFAEANIFSNSTGSWTGQLEWIPECLRLFPATNKESALQADAQNDSALKNMMISTDPPYYDMIGYADLSDYFYIWMRQAIKNTYPEVFKTLLTPKSEELIASPYRFNGDSEKAKEFFESGMKTALSKIHEAANEQFPITIYYAFKQTETDKDNRTSSTGWETMLSAIIKSGLSITATWPIRTERPTGLKAYENALASSIVLVCRKRSDTARTCSRRDFANALKKELKTALEALQASNIAPVDLAQAAIGPGMAIFSRYKQVLDADGSPMSVRSALQLINQEVDSYFNDQDNMLDRSSRFCLDLFMQTAYNEIKFGEADVLARAKNTSVQHLEQAGVLSAEKGSVRLLERDELPPPSPDSERIIWLLCQQLTYTLETGGHSACAAIAAKVSAVSSALEDAKNLAYRLYSFCERKGWAKEAGPYNALVTAWPEIMQQAGDLRQNGGAEQIHF